MQSTSSKTCREIWDEMNILLSERKFIRNFSCCISMDCNGNDSETAKSYTIETDLFPVEALRVYSAYNLGEDIEEAERSRYFSAHRGGSQGDYREGIKEKISNVVDCLKQFPASKRAVITIPNNSFASHKSDDYAKCMREMHFYIDGNVLNATVWMRAQAAEIFPKNIHFIGSLMHKIACALDLKVGELFYLATNLVSVRMD